VFLKIFLLHKVVRDAKKVEKHCVRTRATFVKCITVSNTGKNQ